MPKGSPVLSSDRCLPSPVRDVGSLPSLAHPTLDRYLQFVASRARWNTVLATHSDLRAFFAVIDKPPVEVTVADVLAFIAQQRQPRHDRVVRLIDGEAGMSAQTIKRRLSSVSGLLSWLVLLEEVAANPVPVNTAANAVRCR